MAMPSKHGSTDGGYTFYNRRLIFNKDAGGSKSYNDASQIIKLNAINALGKSSTKSGLPPGSGLTFSNVNNNTVKQHRQRARSSGSAAPKKKGAY